MAERRFPPPWSIEELDACFVVIDGAGQKLTQKLTYAYFEDERGAQIGGKIIGAGQGETDCGKHSKAAMIVSAALLLYGRLAALFCEE